RARIQKAVEDADHAREEARELLEQHRELIAQAKSESAEILADARKVADAQVARVKEEADAERQRRLEETRRQIEAETKRSLDQIRSEVADLTLEATARVTGKVLDAEDQRRLIDEAISELEALVAREQNRLAVELTTAHELSDEDAKAIVAAIEKASGRTVEATRTVDPDLIGGIVLKVGSFLADGSVRGRLERLRREL